jgi:2-polyprenyl-3-methyl-5-hydroxy-6-metoxy-1,4-benzoquinol methylase
MRTHDPIKEISANNQWYIDDQIDQQLKKFGSNKVVSERWDFFKKIIDDYIEKSNEKKVSILDAGCGDGINLIFFKKYLDRATISASDYNPSRLEKVKKRFPEINSFKFDLLNDEFPDLKYDIIILSQVLEHIKEDDFVLEKLHKMLKKSGILILGVPNEGCFLAKIRNKIINPNISKSTDHVNFYREKELRAKIEENYNIMDIMYNGTIFIPHLYLHKIVTNNPLGYKFFKILGALFKSQVAGYYFACIKD